MKKLVKTLSLLLALILCVSFAACGENAKIVASVDDLPGAKIGVQMGTTGDIFASDYEEPESPTETPASIVERYKTGAEAVQALKTGKIDCVIIDEQPAKAFVEKNSDLKILDEPFVEESYAACFKKGSELTAKFNQALADLTTAGVVDQIIKNYIGDDTKGTCAYVTPEGTTYPNGKLIMATNAAFEPYEFIENGKVVGIDAMLAKAICDKLGYELEILDIDFDTIINAVETGKAQFAMAGMTITPDRQKSVDFSTPYTTSKQVIIVKK